MSPIELAPGDTAGADTKRRTLSLRVSEADVTRWTEAAQRDKRPLSQWIRVVLDRACEGEP